jgi:hypothetical protein
MIPKQVPSQNLPEYHDRLLLVRLNPDVKAAADAAVKSFAASAVTTAESVLQVLTGVVPALGCMLRAGMVRRVAPLARRKTKGFMDAASALAASFTDSTSVGQRAIGGTAIVEVERGVDLRTAQNRIVEDTQVQFVSRVPMRYLAVPKRNKPLLLPHASQLHWRRQRHSGTSRRSSGQKLDLPPALRTLMMAELPCLIRALIERTRT